MQRSHALHSPWMAGRFARRLFDVFPFPPASSLFGGLGAGQQRPLAHHRRGHRSSRLTAVPPPCVGHATPGGSYGLFVERRTYSHLCAAAHAPLGHAGLPFHSVLPPGNRAHPTYARTFLLLDRYEHLHPVVVAQLLECQARKTSRKTVRWPTNTTPLPDGPGIALSVDYVGPLPVTPRGNTYLVHLVFLLSFQPPSRHVRSHSG